VRLSLVLAAAALAGSSLIATAHAQEQVNLTWQMWGDESDTALFTSLADLVTAEYPNIKVTPQFSGWTDYWTRLPVLASSGQIADLVAMQSMRMPSFYSILEPLDSYIEADGFDKAAFETSIMDGLSHDGVQYALPYDVGPWLVYYNRDKFAAAGLAEPALDWTFDDFKAAAVALTEGENFGYATQAFDYVAGPIRPDQFRLCRCRGQICRPDRGGQGLAGLRLGVGRHYRQRSLRFGQCGHVYRRAVGVAQHQR
jgi:ABC-type glycerol-3-phosphate transport system substrate-binding protein